MARSHAAPVTRRSFSRLENPLEVPHLIDIQRLSFEQLTNPKEGLLRETIDDISPIEDYTGNLAIVFGDFEFEEPTHSVAECREKDMTYSRPLNVKVAFQNRETGEIREQTVFMGDFPWMTERGTFIINGTERVVVTQLVRSPGAYVMEPKDREKQVFIANLMPARGSWLELEIDKKGRVYARIDRKRKLPVTVLLRAMGFVEDEEILKLFDNSVYIRHTIEADTEPTKTEEGALVELFKKQRPGEPPSVDAARGADGAALLRPQALRPDPGRPLQAQRAPRPRRRPRHPRPDQGRHRRPDQGARHGPEAPRDPGGDRRGEPDQGLRGGGADLPARPDQGPPRRVRALRQPPPADGRRADPGRLPGRPLPDGARRPRAAHDRGLGRDHPADDHQHPPGGRGAEGVLRLLAAVAVHGPDELAGRPHPPAPPLGARRRRPDPRAGADRGSRRPSHPLRPHVPDRDPRGPEHRADRLAVLLRPGLRARVRDHAVPGGQGRRGHQQDRPPGCDPGGGEDDRPGQRRDRPQDEAAQGAPGASAAPAMARWCRCRRSRST